MFEALLIMVTFLVFIAAIVGILYALPPMDDLVW
jgi:hypothetical protein